MLKLSGFGLRRGGFHISITALLVLGLFLVLAGCTPMAPPAPPTPPPPPESTPEQITSEIRASIAPLQAPFQNGGPFQEAQKDPMLSALRAAKAQHEHTENGKTALTQILHEVNSLVHQAEDQKRWRLVMAAIQASEILDPAGSAQFAKLKDIATLELNKPRVVIRGWWVDKAAAGTPGTEQVYVSLEVTDPKTGQVHQIWVREGQEFDNLKFVRIFGNLSGVVLEYLPIPGEQFVVKK